MRSGQFLNWNYYEFINYYWRPHSWTHSKTIAWWLLLSCHREASLQFYGGLQPVSTYIWNAFYINGYRRTSCWQCKVFFFIILMTVIRTTWRRNKQCINYIFKNTYIVYNKEYKLCVVFGVCMMCGTTIVQAHDSANFYVIYSHARHTMERNSML